MQLNRTSGIIPISMAVLLLAISVIDFAGRAAQRAVSNGVVLCSVALMWFALRRSAFWFRVSNIAVAGVAAMLAIRNLASW
jgi:predicted benzoate:H+ symporter BenE